MLLRLLRRRVLAWLVVPALVLPPVLAGHGAAAVAAQAAECPVSGGRLDWGVKASFQTYVTGPIAQGGWTLSDGATTAGESQFRFHSASGDYDPGSGSVTAGYTGGVRFTGHQTDSGAHQLDLTISDPTVEISGSSGTLYADMRGKDRETGEFTDASQVPLASLDLTGVDLRGGTQIAVSTIPATLTREGAGAFAGYYQAGDPLDPVTFTADTVAPEPDPAPEPQPEPQPEPEPGRDPGLPQEGGAFADAAVDWGVRRTFREYVTGNVAQGRWELSGGARDGGAVFRFPAGEGTFDAVTGTVEATFTGAVRFTGTGLDLELGGVTVKVADGTGTLAADVTTAEGTQRGQPLVTFPAAGPAPDGGLLLIDEAPAELTGAGADAFSGLYQPGAAMDPVTLAVALDPDAELPALPDLGSEPTAAVEPDPAGEAGAGQEPGEESRGDAAGAAADEAGGSSSSGTVLAVTGAGALLLVGAAAFLVLRRQRSPQPTPTEEETPTP